MPAQSYFDTGFFCRLRAQPVMLLTKQELVMLLRRLEVFYRMSSPSVACLSESMMRH